MFNKEGKQAEAFSNAYFSCMWELRNSSHCQVWWQCPECSAAQICNTAQLLDQIFKLWQLTQIGSRYARWQGKRTIFVPIIGLHGCQGGRKKHINYTTRSSSQARRRGQAWSLTNKRRFVRGCSYITSHVLDELDEKIYFVRNKHCSNL